MPYMQEDKEMSELTIDLTTSDIKRIAEGSGTASATQAIQLARLLLYSEESYNVCFNDRVKLLGEAQERETKLREALDKIQNCHRLAQPNSAGQAYYNSMVIACKNIARDALASEYSEEKK